MVVYQNINFDLKRARRPSEKKGTAFLAAKMSDFIGAPQPVSRAPAAMAVVAAGKFEAWSFTKAVCQVICIVGSGESM